MKVFVIKSASTPEKPLPKRYEITKTVMAEGTEAQTMAKNREFYRVSEVRRWWELEHSQAIMCELIDGSFMEVQKV